ncbi:Rieske (2Fe-2S) protein [Methylobacterium sp. JK268]
MSETWIPVAPRAALEARPILPVRAGGLSLILVREGTRIVAAERACPHEGADLARGRCAAGRLHCPHHRAAFSLDDGRISAGWPSRPLRLYPARVIGDDVAVAIGAGRDG